MSVPYPTHDSPRAKWLRRNNPNFGWCACCGFPWSTVKGHETQYKRNSGCFPLCEECWAGLGTPEERVPYYMALIKHWEECSSVNNDDKVAIFAAVLDGG